MVRVLMVNRELQVVFPLADGPVNTQALGNEDTDWAIHGGCKSHKILSNTKNLSQASSQYSNFKGRNDPDLLITKIECEFLLYLENSYLK